MATIQLQCRGSSASTNFITFLNLPQAYVYLLRCLIDTIPNVMIVHGKIGGPGTQQNSQELAVSGRASG